MNADFEMLTSMSVAELEALADGKLAPAGQARLDELLAKHNALPLPADEKAELDRLLDVADQLMILKTRARYTLRQLNAGAVRS